MRAAGGRPYVIPEGGSNALGSWGYMRATHELAEDLAGIAAPDHPVTIVYACGSGGTGAGLVLGAKLLGLAERGIRVAGINVCDDRAYFVDAIGKICADFEERWQLAAHVTADDIEIVDGHVGLGYAKSRPEELATIGDVCRSDGVVLDPVYTGKAFHGVVTELRRDPKRFGAAVAFIHTGGLFGLFGLPITTLVKTDRDLPRGSSRFRMVERSDHCVHMGSGHDDEARCPDHRADRCHRPRARAPPMTPRRTRRRSRIRTPR